MLSTGYRIDNIYYIDGMMFGEPGILSVYLLKEKDVVLCDGGNALSVSHILDCIKKIGINPKDVSLILVSHLHSDHTFGVGYLLNEMPRAKVLIHPSAAEGLVDPSGHVIGQNKWAGSTYQVQMHGYPIPVPAYRVESVNNNDVIDIGGNKLKVIYSPGHDTNHISFLEEKGNGLFVGDSIGVFLSDFNCHLINTATGANLRQWSETVKMYKELKPSRLFHSHSGIITENVDKVLDQTLAKIEILSDIISKATQKGETEDIPNNYRMAFSSDLERLRPNRPIFYEHINNVLLPKMWARVVKGDNLRIA